VLDEGVVVVVVKEETQQPSFGAGGLRFAGLASKQQP
jgi:hypothetical protein